jgi:hypothetical protein
MQNKIGKLRLDWSAIVDLNSAFYMITAILTNNNQLTSNLLPSYDHRASANKDALYYLDKSAQSKSNATFCTFLVCKNIKNQLSLQTISFIKSFNF